MDNHPEAHLISALLNIKSVLSAEEYGIRVGHFHEYKIEYEWLLDFRIKYGKEPDATSFKTAFPNFSLSGHVDVEFCCEQVKISHVRYALTRIYREGVDSLREKKENPFVVLDQLHSSYTKLVDGIDVANPLVDSLRDYSEALDFALERATSEIPPGAPFPHPSVQERTLGMQSGDLWLTAARLGQGKTWILVYYACQSLMTGKDVVFFSLEMNKRQIEYRFQTVLARLLGLSVDNDSITKGRNLDLLDYKNLLTTICDRVPGKLYICDRRKGSVTARSVAAEINKYTPDLAVIDYIQIMASTHKYSQSWENMSVIVDEVKDVACRFDLPILSAAQINREGERGSWRPPKALHLAGTDSLGRDADCVITTKRFGNGAMVYSLEKNRHGPSGDIWFSRFRPNEGDFAEIPRVEAEAIRDRDGEYEEDL